MRIFVTGKPGVGKTTLILKVAEELRARSFRVGGMVTQDVREHGRRVGFKIRALDTGEEGILAWIGEGHPKVGRYAVNLSDLERIGVESIRRAINNADLIIIDEIGAMELKRGKFEKVLEEAINSEKPMLAVLHRKLVDQFRGMGRIYTVSYENRERLKDGIVDILLKSIERNT